MTKSEQEDLVCDLRNILHKIDYVTCNIDSLDKRADVCGQLEVIAKHLRELCCVFKTDPTEKETA
jgi:hypothetical protein